MSGSGDRRAGRWRWATAGVALAGTVLVSGAVAVTGADTIVTVAGTGKPASGGDGGPAAAAGLTQPLGLAFDAAGNLYVSDALNHRIRRIDPTGLITTVAGTGAPGDGPDGGPATGAPLRFPADVAVDAAGNLYVTEQAGSAVRRVDTAGRITTVAGTGTEGAGGDGGPAVSAQLDQPIGIAVAADGTLYIADRDNDRVRRVDPAGTITTFAGTGDRGYGGDGGPATAAQLNGPRDVVLDAAGGLYVADTGNHRVRYVAAGGTITTVAGTGAPTAPLDRVAATGSGLNGPRDLALDLDGTLYIADSLNQRVRHVDAEGFITTVAGGNRGGFAGDGGFASGALLRTPDGLAVDGAGRLYVSDRYNHRVRRIEPAALCAVVPEPAAPVRSGRPGVKLTARQLLINQRIAQAAVRRANAIGGWLDAGLESRDLCGRGIGPEAFGPGVRTGPTDVVPSEERAAPRPLTVAAPARRRTAVRLSARQLLIGQRIAQAAVRRANALEERLEAGLTGGDLRDGSITPGKLARGLRILTAAEEVPPAPSATRLAPARGGRDRVTLTASQLLINQRIAQAAVHRTNALRARLGRGFTSADFRPGTLTAADLAD